MSKIPLNKIIDRDLPRGVALLGDLSTTLNSALLGVKAFSKKVKNGNYISIKGISLLDLKNQAFLSYLTNLTYLMLRKLKGAKLEGDHCIEYSDEQCIVKYRTRIRHGIVTFVGYQGCFERLVELRAVLERIRPLEDKLKYQIDKYVKVANEGALGVDDPLRLRGNLENIGSSSDEEEEAEDTKKKKAEKDDDNDDNVPKIYKVPKVAPVHYGG
ncbi:hypothetical protein SK128_018317 [Halocaridina rubra]|uniref:Uncharacterized protein n=1 Tax=Halocaridina rubra TaxID=373956 RepID=A0AAN8X111_HALRR